MLYHLGCHEFWSAAKRAGCLTEPHFFFAQTVISYLDMTIQRQQDIVQFQVTKKLFAQIKKCHRASNPLFSPIDDSIGMEILQCKKHFRSIEFGLTKRKLLSLDV